MNTDTVKTILSSLLERLELPFSDIELSQEGDFWRVDIVSEKPSRLIGWHGETLNALQHLTKAMVRSADKMEKSPFLVLDTDGYRRDQEDKVRGICEHKASFVRKTGNRVALSPMSPYFRRIVHLHIANSENLQDLTTSSIGEGDYRQVVIKLKDEKAARGNTGKDIAEGEELTPVVDADDGLDNLDI